MNDYISTSKVAVEALKLLNIKETARNSDNLRRSINELIQKKELKGIRDHKFYYLSQEQVNYYLKLIKENSHVLPPSIIKELNQHDDQQLFADIYSSVLNANGVEKLKQLIQLYDDGIIEITTEQLQNIITNHHFVDLKS